MDRQIRCCAPRNVGKAQDSDPLLTVHVDRVVSLKNEVDDFKEISRITKGFEVGAIEPCSGRLLDGFADDARNLPSCSTGV